MTTISELPSTDLLTNWRAIRYSSVVGTGIVGRGGMVIATVPGPKEYAEPIAQLIAAAPDLLALARQYAGECAMCGGSGENIHASGPAPEDEYSKACEDCADIRAVIAKAEGRS